MNLAPTAQDMPDMAIALLRAIIAAADKDRDEMTVLLIHGEPAAVIAPYGHERRPGAAAEIRFGQTAPPEARLVLTDVWGGSIRMSTGEFRQLAREGSPAASRPWRRSRNPGRSCHGALPDRVGADMSDWQYERWRDRARRDEVMSLPVLPVRRHGVIDGPDGDVLVCASVGPAGEVAAVWTAPEALEAVTSTTVSASGASFPDPAAARSVAARITVHAPGFAAVAPVQDLALAHVTVQPMPGGRFLVAGARCRWRPGGPDRNAVLYDSDGQVVSEHVLGDGIGHVLATSTGQVWAGYFDEGIYGNYGWGRAEGAEPVGAYGIVRFSPDLEPAWHYPKYTEIGPWDAISDCYALNVDDTSTWACYYSDFPVVRIRDSTVTGWHNDI